MLILCKTAAFGAFFMQKAPVGAYKLGRFASFIRPKGKIALLGAFCFKIKPPAAQKNLKSAKTLAFYIGTLFAILRSKRAHLARLGHVKT